MSLPSREILDGIRDLISEVTGFQENHENFAICERYCLSHVVHHTYPFVNRTSLKNLVNSYVSRFYSHGYFKVSQELNHQVKSFLSNEALFEKNPQYDIQWCLLGLLSSLSSNLTLIKELPELLPIDVKEDETEDFDWKEYLTNNLEMETFHKLSSDSEGLSRDDENEEEEEEEEKEEHDEENDFENEKNKQLDKTIVAANEVCMDKKNVEILFDNKSMCNTEGSSEIRKQKIEEFLNSKRSKRNLENDIRRRGNITEKFDMLMNNEGIIRKIQIISELETLENILFQFQTGERIFARKGLLNPALTSLTENTLCNYLENLQPYFTIIRCFKDFDADVKEAKYSEKLLDKSDNFANGCQSSSAVVSVTNQKKKISSVLYMYNIMLRKVLEPFQQEVTEIVENLGDYTLIQMEQKLKPYYNDLASFFYVHNLATKNWTKDLNWVSSIRILSVLYIAIMNATSTKMSFLYLNFFLHCFRVYLDLIDNWISFVELIDPNDEFIVAKSGNSSSKKLENECSEYEIRPYKTEIQNLEVKKVVVLDFIAEKMIHVGQSLEVLKRLNRFVTKEGETSNESSYHLLVKAVDEKIRSLEKVKTSCKNPISPEKQKSIFTVKNINLGVGRDNGGGDSWGIGSLLIDIVKEDEKKNKEPSQVKQMETADKSYSYYEELINSMVRNPFMKMAFDSIGMKQVQKQLEEAKARQRQDSGVETFMVVRNPECDKVGIYPLHKIITETFRTIFESRTSGACALVKSIVLEEYKLPTHLSLLRSILLFNDSYLIQPFVLALYTQAVIWRSSYSLSFHLKECVRSFYKDYANALSVVLSKKDFIECDNILHVIDVITIKYEVKWPLTLIITPEAMRKYNEIFRLALKLKWAHWALCNRLCQDKHEYERSSKSTCHRLQILRFWLLSALGRINNYFLAQMTPSDINLSSCSDLKEMIYRHTEFLENVHFNCLLGEKLPEGRKIILETLIPLCMDLVQEGSGISNAKLTFIEKTFGSCHLLLSRLWSSLEK